MQIALICFGQTTRTIESSHHSSLSKEASMKLKHFYEQKSVLVTGGCGFIGSHVAQELVKLGAHVTIIDDLSTGFEKNIAEFRDSVRFIQKSIVDADACNEAVAGSEIIFHLAAYTSVPGSVANPQLCHEINVDGTFNLLHAAHKHHVKRFVFSSTSSVYGPREDTCYESDTHLNPISPYGTTKLIGELYCDQFSLLFQVPCVMLRYFNVFGPRQNPDSQYAAVVAKFKQKMERNEPIIIFGDGLQTRDFIHVSAVAEANLIAGMAPEAIVNRQRYNIGTGTSISVLELAADMKRHYPQYTRETMYEEARDGDVRHTQMSAQKFRSLKEYVGEIFD